jgi:hypothetical protein
MKYCTKITALNPEGDMVEFSGPIIESISPGMAAKYCQENGLGYCQIDGELIAEIPCDENYKADFSKEIDYDILN